MEHFKDNSGCSGPKKSEIFWNNSRKVQYVFARALDLLHASNQFPFESHAILQLMMKMTTKQFVFLL